MTFLRIFLGKLTADEIFKLKMLDLKGNESEVLLESIKQCHKPNCNDESIQKKFNLSKSYFDKINSVLLNKCVAAIAGSSNYEKTFALFQEKDLPELLIHEIKITEKKTLKTADAEEVTKFYYVVFQNLRRLPVSEFNDELLVDYMNKYLKSKTYKTIEDEVEVKTMLEAQRVFVKAASGEMKNYEPDFIRTMKNLAKKIEGKPFYKAHFHYQLAWANYYDFFSNNFEELVNSLKIALDYFDKANGNIPQTYRMYAITKLAKAYCQGSYFEDALKIYSEAFDHFGEQLSRNPYHPTMFAVVAIINGKYEQAEKMMNENLLHLLNKEKPGTIDFDIYRTYAILYMNQSKFDKAFLYLEEALKFRRSNMSLLGDILLRMVHNAYFILSGDLSTAKTTLNRNFKFLASKSADPMAQEYATFFDMLKQIIRYREGKKLPKDFAEKLAPFRQGIMKLYGDLLDKMID